MNGPLEKTWMQYNAVRKHLERAQIKLRIKFVFPMTEEQVLAFVSHLFTDRNLTGKYVSSLLSALRMLHIATGHSSPELRYRCGMHVVLKNNTYFSWHT